MKRKVIRITIMLKGEKQEVFTTEGQNTLSSTGLSVSCNLTFGNGAITPTAQITVYGLTLDKMLKLMRVQWNTMQALLNTVRIEVGNDGEELQLAYEGNITQATIDANAAPNIPLIITSQMAAYEKSKFSGAVTTKGGPVHLSDIAMFIAFDMGYKFTNDGVERVVSDVVLEGSSVEKLQKLAIAYDFDLYIEQKTVAICKKGGARTLKIPVISPSTGMQGYPVFDIKGISFSCLYDPLVRFGGLIRIKDSLLGEIVNTDWRVYGYTAQLESNIQNGRWHINGNATWRDSTDVAVQK